MLRYNNPARAFFGTNQSGKTSLTIKLLNPIGQILRG
jgi:hypothetical protein